MTKIVISFGIVASLICGTGVASTPSAWAALDRAAQAACKGEIVRLASKAKVAKISGRVSGIGMGRDSDRYYALTLRGTTAGFASQWLCLYDKTGKRAVAREIETP